MSDASKTVAPMVAAYALYRAYSSGALDTIKDKIFGDPKSDQPSDFPSRIPTDFSTPSPNDSIDIQPADTTHGLPAENIVFDPNVFQYYDDTCAIQSQHLILQQFGIDKSQEELIEIAKENGWYTEGYGTPMDKVGKLLEHFGIDIHGSCGNNIFNLSNELAQGHQLIVGVDSNELIYPMESLGIDEIHGEQADHALVVVGIDTSDTHNVKVIVTDPGNGNRQMAYPAEQFMNAWKDSDCFMVATDKVPTNSSFSHIDSFAGIPIDTLDRLSGMDINMDNGELYSNFVDKIMENPSSLDELMSSSYQGLFDQDSDSDNESDGE